MDEGEDDDLEPGKNGKGKASAEDKQVEYSPRRESGEEIPMQVFTS